MITKRMDVFCLETEHTGYYIAPRGPLMEQLHYGRKIQPDQEALREKIGGYGSSVIYDEELDPNLALMNLCLELSPTEKGDFRRSALALTMPDGSGICDLKFQGGEILAETPENPDLPQAKGGDGCLKLSYSDGGLTVESYYTVFEATDVIVRSMRILNGTEGAVVLRRAMSYQLDLPRCDYCLTTLTGAWARELRPETRALSRGVSLFGNHSGTSSHYCNPFFLLEDPEAAEEQGNVYGFNLIWSGSHQETVEADPYGRTRIMGGISPEDCVITLQPGAEFSTPQAVLTFSHQGRGGMSRNMHRFVKDHILRSRWAKAPRPVLVNNWEATYFDFNERRLLGLAKKASELGAELFVLDDGWFGRRENDQAGLGDYDVNRKKLPSGLDGFAAKLRKLGLAFGLWVEPEMVNRNSALYEQHPDWAIEPPEGTACLSRHQLVLDLCRTEVQDYLIEQLNTLLDSAPISYIKWDMNRHQSDRFSGELVDQGRFPYAYTAGLYRVLRTVTEAHPEVLFEGCASGGNRFDLGMLCYMPQIWLSDNTDAWQRARMQYAATLGYPPCVMGCHVSASPNHQTLRQTPLDSRFDVAAMGLLGYELDLGALTPAEEKAIQEQTALYKQHRDLFQQGEIFRLRDPSRADRAVWMAVSADKSRAAVLEMRGVVEPNDMDPPLRLRGLDGDRVYRVTVRPQTMDFRSFGTLINMVLPVRVDDRGVLAHVAAGRYQLPCEKERYTVSGSLLMHAGIKRKQPFGGTAFGENVRPMGDFSARLYLIEAVEERH